METELKKLDGPKIYLLLYISCPALLAPQEEVLV